MPENLPGCAKVLTLVLQSTPINERLTAPCWSHASCLLCRKSSSCCSSSLHSPC